MPCNKAITNGNEATGIADHVPFDPSFTCRSLLRIGVMGFDESLILSLEQLRRLFEANDFPGVGCRVAVGIGFAACEREASPTTIIGRADKALYRAKQNGRNTIVSHADVVSKNAEGLGEVDMFES